MKKNIHPEYHTVEAKCSTCQKSFTFKSVKPNFTLDVCSGCHPVYTGSRAQVKATGRIDRFNRRLEKKNSK
ncbi:50S ribosomal protein L31 [Mycoplasmopsis verecunda]|uniref:Large ribosomal subunit protein bL31 n=1 Tax=Mycoplasmopsis verecunda TaxID=171291 RepID=A0A1T4LDQ4_9BACT|nr:50S ribosomal protein L31 [Mycoplasmopsis verecunda]WPB54321.1 50S ribosomal protein L31 [Mycoplasmopsis verecunda]SJZ52793.1 LSU ribosomal protein L31P [Mycoplasmopsis verecunda]